MDRWEYYNPNPAGNRAEIALSEQYAKQPASTGKRFLPD